ncbi:MAG: hypothetical protein SNF60_05980 [Rikenellaceae bacterium]
MFQHTHVIDGATIIHSHIYGANHDQSSDGGHTQGELTIINYLATQVAISAETLNWSLALILSAPLCYIIAISTPFVERYICRERSPRAPPVLSIF